MLGPSIPNANVSSNWASGMSGGAPSASARVNQALTGALRPQSSAMLTSQTTVSDSKHWLFLAMVLLQLQVLEMTCFLLVHLHQNQNPMGRLFLSAVYLPLLQFLAVLKHQISPIHLIR